MGRKVYDFEEGTLIAGLKKQIHEIGSEFHWVGIPQGPFVKWPVPHVMFSSGRTSLLSLYQILPENFSKTLFVPDYFCHEVSAWWSKQGVLIKRYVDGPQFPEPVWRTLTASTGDAVLAVNYFGVRDELIWQKWRESHSSVFLIEDHSHDPVSRWALNSGADYAFASLRKTFPVPDGAILWSPKGLILPAEAGSPNWRGSALKLAAMILKKEYLNSGNEHLKDIFRNFQQEGERTLEENISYAISPWSRFLLDSGYPVRWRNKREDNVRMLLDLIEGNSMVQSIFAQWPTNHCPFNAIVLFASKTIREQYRTLLIKGNVFPSVHWELSNATSMANQEISERIMTIPVDQRYKKSDIYQIAKILMSEQ